MPAAVQIKCILLALYTYRDGDAGVLLPCHGGAASTDRLTVIAVVNNIGLLKLAAPD